MFSNSRYNFTTITERAQPLTDAQQQSWTPYDGIQVMLDRGELIGLKFGTQTLEFASLFTRFMDDGKQDVTHGNYRAWFATETHVNWVFADPTSPYILFNTDNYADINMYNANQCAPTLSAWEGLRMRHVINQLCKLISMGCPPDELLALYAKQHAYLERTERGAFHSLFVNAIACMLDDHLSGRSFAPAMRTRCLSVPELLVTKHVLAHANYTIHNVVS